jgi:glycosyltransferase involved in cell wall biosynthesis
LVNDGSKDTTLVMLQTLSLRDERVKYISFSRNFGKEAGMLAGLTYASGDAVIILDADLQHPPSLIPQLLEGYNEGFDQVIAKRNRTGDKVVRTAFSRLYYKIMNKFVDIELTDGVGDFRLLSRKAVNSLLSLQEYNRFSKGLFSWIGYKTKVIEYENVLRNEGESSWSFSSLLNYGIDGVISFNNRPLRMLIYLGLFVMITGLVYILFTFFQIIFSHKSTPGYFTTISAILLLGGIQLISLGVIGEYIGRIYYETKKRPQFIIDETNVEIPKLKQVVKK